MTYKSDKKTLVNDNKVKSKTSKTIKMFSINAAGVVTGKQASLNSEVNATQANIVTLQETHSTRKGKVTMPGEFVVFEAIRREKNGGTLIAVHDSLNPKLINEYDDPFELLVVEVKLEHKSIRIISGVGPHLAWDETKRMPFFIALEAEVVSAQIAGRSVLI